MAHGPSLPEEGAYAMQLADWFVVLAAKQSSARKGLPSEASGHHVSPSAAALPSSLLPLGSGALSGSQSHICRRGKCR